MKTVVNEMMFNVSDNYKIRAAETCTGTGNYILEVELFDADDSYVQTLAKFRNSADQNIIVDLYDDPQNGEGLDVYTDYKIEIVQDSASEDSEEVFEPEENNDDPDILKYGDTGEEVKKLQRRLKELGYFAGDIGGNYLNKTKASVEFFQQDAGLQVDGVCDKITWDRAFAEDAPINETKVVSLELGEDQEFAKEMDWWKSDIQKIFAKGVTATITDVETRLQWKEKRRGGTNHADVQPLTAEDTAKLKKVYGEKWSWNRRAIWVTINGVTYAASMNGMPHGGSSIKNNNFDGHHCIHFANSRTHCSNKVCPKHQNAIKKAAKTAL